MKDRKHYPQELLDQIPSGFAGELELLQYDYTEKYHEVCAGLNALTELHPDCSEASEWKAKLTESQASFHSCLQSCVEQLVALEEKVRIGQLSLANEQVCRDVSKTEAQVLSMLTELQRLNSEALKPVFSLNLPALIKTLPDAEKKLLRDAVNRQTENTQYFSNELQHLAIMLKERNKIITHPLDENHPE